MMRALLVCASVFLAASNLGLAQAPPSVPAAPAAPMKWQSLSPQQQQLLHGFQDKWDNLPPDRQQPAHHD